MALTFTKLAEEQDQRPDPAEAFFFFRGVHSQPEQFFLLSHRANMSSKEKLRKHNWSN